MRSSSHLLPAALPPVRLLEDVGLMGAETQQSGRVVQRFRTGFYLATASVPVLPVLGPGALELPTGIRVPGLDSETLSRIAGGDSLTVSVTRRHVNLVFPASQLEIRGVRSWRPARITANIRTRPARVTGAVDRSASTGTQAADPRSVALAHELSPRLRPGADNLGERISAVTAALEDPAGPGRAGLNRDGLDRALLGLVGLGPGSTPSGDDALCGVLLTLRGLGRDRELNALREALSRFPLADRTTALSASLIRAAARGYCIPQVSQAILMLTGSPQVSAGHTGSGRASHSVTGTVDHLLELAAAVGHFSGHDLLAGAAAVLDCGFTSVISTGTTCTDPVAVSTSGTAAHTEEGAHSATDR